MKIAIAILVGCLTIAGAADVQLRVVRHNKEVAVADAATFATNVLKLLRSCSVNHTPAKSWDDVARSDSFVQIQFTNPPSLKVMWGGFRDERPIDEIRIWLPEGQWPTIQARSGGAVMACGKYDPIALKRVVSEPALDLGLVRPYDTFLRSRDTR
jgi:hypothetical protein